MASFMAPVPRFFFCFFEPAVVTLGGLQIVLDPANYSPPLLSYVPAHKVAPTEQLAIASFGNFMMLVGAMIAVVMWKCREPAVARPIVAALILTDVGIWMSSIRIMGWQQFADAGNWSGKLTHLFTGMLITVVLKFAYLMGWLGADTVTGDEIKAKRAD